MTLGREFLIVVLLTMVGGALRLIDLEHESIWLDEAYSLNMATYPPHAILTREVNDPGNPPLYYVLLSLWQSAFGHSIESARALSAIAGALVPLATWWLASAARCSRPTRLVAVLLVTFSPPLIFLSREARVYALFTLVVTTAAAAAETWIQSSAMERRQRIRAGLVFTLLASSFSYLHYYGILILPVFGVAMAARTWRDGPRRIVTIAIFFAVVAAAFLPWVPTLREQIAIGTERSGTTWLLHLEALPLVSLAGTTLIWKDGDPVMFAILDLISLFVVILPTVLYAIRARVLPAMPATLAVGLLLIVVTVSILKSPMLHSRYMTPIFPCGLIVLSAGLVAGFSQWARLARVAAIVLGGLTVASLASLYTVEHKEDWRPGAAWIAKEPWLEVFCYEDMAKLSLHYYLPHLRIQPITSVFSPDGQAWIQDGTLERMKARKTGFWFVLYLSLATRHHEREPIEGWLREHFRIAAMDPPEPPTQFPMIRIYRVEPRP